MSYFNLTANDDGLLLKLLKFPAFFFLMIQNYLETRQDSVKLIIGLSYFISQLKFMSACFSGTKIPCCFLFTTTRSAKRILFQVASKQANFA